MAERVRPGHLGCGEEVLDGQYYGVTTDANPSVLWHNKNVLEAAGISETPYETFAAGNWTTDYFRDLVARWSAPASARFVASSWWFDFYPWLTSNGGTIC